MPNKTRSKHKNKMPILKKISIWAISLLLFAAIVIGIIIGVMIYKHKIIIERIFSQSLGVEVRINDIKLDYNKGILDISDFRMHNPEGFPKDEILIYIPKITAEFNPRSIMIDKKLHFTKVYIYVKSMGVIKNRDGRTNVDEIAFFKESSEEIPLVTDKIVLTAESVVFKDYSKGKLPVVETFNVNIKDATYAGFPTADDVAAKVFSEILGRTTIKGIKIMGVAVLAGAIGGWTIMLPAGAAVVLIGKDSYKATFDVSYDEAYKASLEVAREFGKNISENKIKGIIKGDINNCSVAIKIDKLEDNKVDVIVSARKHFFPKRERSGGILFEIAQKISKGK